jgi:hypothetical protein
MASVMLSLAETGGPFGATESGATESGATELGAAVVASALGEPAAGFDVPQAKRESAITQHSRITKTDFNDFLISISPSLLFNGNQIWTGNIAVSLQLVASFHSF